MQKKGPLGAGRNGPMVFPPALSGHLLQFGFLVAEVSRLPYGRVHYHFENFDESFKRRAIDHLSERVCR